MNVTGTLPPLEGRLGAVARYAYLLLALLTFIIVTGSLVFNGLDFFRNVPAGGKWGLHTFSSTIPGAPPYIGWASPAAQARGLRAKDTIVVIQGEYLPAGTTEFGIGKRLNAIEGGTLTLVTRGADGQRRTVTLPRVVGAWHQPDFTNGLPQWLSSTINFLGIEVIPIFLFGASLLLFSRRPSDPEAMLFATGFLLLCNLPVSDFWLLAILNIPVTVIGALLDAGQCIVIIAAAGFPDGRFDSPWSRVVLVAAVPLTILSRTLHSFASNAVASGRMSAVMLLLLSGIAMIVLSQRYRVLEESRPRQQIKWVGLGFCVSAFASAAYMSLLASDFGVARGVAQFIAFQLLQLVAFIALPLGLVVSLLRYRLYDAEATISRSAAYAVLTASLVVVFAATEKLVELLGTNMLGGDIGVIAGGMAAGIAAVMIAPLHHRIDQWAKHRFQHALLRLREGLPVLVGDLREVGSLEQLARAVLERVAEGVHARGMALLADGRVLAVRGMDSGTVDAWRERQGPVLDGLARIDRCDPLFPLRIPLMIETETRIGWLLVGPRPDGSFYRMDDLETLAEIADPVARAIMICQRHETANRNLSEQVQSLTARLERVEAMLAGGKPDQPLSA